MRHFTAADVATHGAYLHNDFVRARSHGCVNVLPDAAQWFYRWMQPVTTYDDGDVITIVDR